MSDMADLYNLESIYNSAKTFKLSGLKTLQVDHQSFETRCIHFQTDRNSTISISQIGNI